MDFARKQLEKYGWKEGDGLGKTGNEGIKVAIKPHYKKGREGMGFDFAKEHTDAWWARSYDASLKAINVNEESESGTDITIETTRNPTEDKRSVANSFWNFSKKATLTNGEYAPEAKKCEEDSSSDEDGPPPSKIAQLTDEQLFKACGGRTAHKGARHGLKLSGKLARIAAQDAFLTAHPDKLQPKEKRKKKKKKAIDDAGCGCTSLTEVPVNV